MALPERPCPDTDALEPCVGPIGQTPQTNASQYECLSLLPYADLAARPYMGAPWLGHHGAATTGPSHTDPNPLLTKLQNPALMGLQDLALAEIPGVFASVSLLGHGLCSPL